MHMTKKKVIRNMANEISRNQTHLNTKYFFIIICSIEILFIFYQFFFASTRNGGTFLTTFLIVLAILFPPGLVVALHIFRNKPWSFLFFLGLSVGFGFVDEPGLS